jgi:ABC-2 type transport system permease protein
MRKLLAVTKREYFKIVWTKTFIVSTLLAPVFMIAISVLPMLLITMKGEPVRMVIVDPSGRIAPRLRQNLSPEKQLENFREAAEESSYKNLGATQDEKMKQSAKQIGGNFALEDFPSAGKTDEQIRAELITRVKEDQLDAFLIVPPEPDLPNAKLELFSRNPGDIITREVLSKAIDDAVRSDRLSKANINEAQLKEIGQKVNLETTKVSDKGLEKDPGWGFGIGFAIGIMIYVTLAIYGAAILQAIIEEKETRIAEILFSSAKPFELMMGKLLGVGLAGMTQVGIWAFSALILLTSGVVLSLAGGQELSLPNISFGFVAYFLIFFLLGFFMYATIYAVIGSMVTTPQEGQQLAFPPILILMMGFFSMFAVIRDPNSVFSFWVSVAPFTAPIVMPVRIAIETPPFWQIAFSIILNVLTIVGLIWIASRVYRVGMLMYGKRATIPEMWRWVWQK